MAKTRKESFVYLGKTVRVKPDGYFNATELCSAGNVNVSDFTNGQTYKDYATDLPEGVPGKYVITSGVDKGTWVHPKIKRPLWDWIKNYKKRKKNRVKHRNPIRNANFFYATDTKQYQAMVNLFSLTPQHYDVDHIIPLNNSKICGLNVPWNSQVIPRYYNLFKSGTYNPELFLEQNDKNIDVINNLMIHYLNNNSSGSFM